MQLPSDWAGRLKLPLIVAPMFLVSSPELVIASCKAGAIGSFPTGNARTLEELEIWLQKISGALSDTDAPWAVNLVVHRTNNRLAQDLALVEKFRPPLVITALGSPGVIVDSIHAYGGLIFADVNSVKQARQASKLGVDGLILVTAGAGGHTGQMAAFSMIPAIREFFDGIVVSGGGITNGAGIRATELLGADMASMGTRFIACSETLASQEYRQMLIESSIEDLVLTKAVTGVSAYWLRQSLIAAGLDIDALEREIPVDFTDPKNAARRWTRVWSAGHGVGATKSVEDTRDLLASLSREYWRAVDLPTRVARLASAPAARAM
ncbi:NAD(P)H-dependent flavin oxidoreductase [Undibacterium sp. TJN25]|uniref:NAD(P)H-dependent flavin oxidoreductase n=1 Tax=Undibacterium sp. TJN25 TaxID=3413056 RepID=UPI003BF2A148